MSHSGRRSYPLLNRHFNELVLNYSEKQKALWCYLNSTPRPCFTSDLLREMREVFSSIDSFNQQQQNLQYVVLASKVPGFFSLGGDLDLFSSYIRNADRDGLVKYARACVDLSYACINQFDQNITSIALVQGNALGGGFEAALSCNVVIAEESARMGFPEILFNLFPGMGAYSFLLRRTSLKEAEEMLCSGNMYSAEALLDKGAIDYVVSDGYGERAVQEYIEGHRIHRNAKVAMHKAKLKVQPVSLKELYDITDIWVDAALQLDERSLKLMQRLIRVQSYKMRKSVPGQHKISAS